MKKKYGIKLRTPRLKISCKKVKAKGFEKYTKEEANKLLKK